MPPIAAALGTIALQTAVETVTTKLTDKAMDKVLNSPDANGPGIDNPSDNRGLTEGDSSSI